MITLQQFVEEFLASKRSPETFQVFWNTTMGETWEEGDIVIDDGSLYGRREKYGPKVPMAAAILVSSVDVQDDRLEMETVAYGPGEESWQMDYRMLLGDPSREQVWKDLDDVLLTPWEHESGIQLKVAAVGVDTGGHHTQEAYLFVKPRQFRRVYAFKGSNLHGQPILGRFKVQKPLRVKLFMIGSDTAKGTIMGRLKIQEYGPKYMHFPIERDEEYFRQLISERPVPRFVKGRRVLSWEKKPGVRNEALDLRVYNLAALYTLNANLTKLSENLKKRAEKIKAEEREHPVDVKPAENISQLNQTDPPAPVRKEKIVPRRKKGWATNWRWYPREGGCA